MDQKARLHRLLGGWEVGFGPPEVLSESPVPGGRVLDLRFPVLGSGHPDSHVPASLAVPDTPGPHPALLWAHAHGNRYDIGRRELTEGRPALSSPPLPELLSLGLAVLCVEMPAFGSRSEPSESARAKALLWQGRTLFGQMLAELSAGLGYLAARPGIDPERLGVAGISMGGTQAFWLAALDARVRAAVSFCAFADLAGLVAAGAHDAHGIYMTVPGLLPEISTGALAGLAAPRAQLIGVGLADPFTPRELFAPARAELEAAYAGAPGRLEFHVSEATGHVETPEMRGHWLDFLKRHLLA